MKRKNQEATITPEWSRRFDVSQLGKGPHAVRLDANEQERKDLARRLMILSIDALEANLVLKRADGGNVIHVTGTFKTLVQQACITTQAPIAVTLEDEVEGWFADKEVAISLVRARHERLSRHIDAEIPMLEEHEDPEPLENGHIDLGELVSQHISLSIDPFLQAEGVDVVIPPPADPDEAAVLRRNPFAGLKDWKAGRSEKGKK